MIDEVIEKLLDRGSVKDLIALPDAIFDRFMERLRERRDAQVLRFPGDDTPEG